MKKELSIFTVCNVAYLSKTLALAQSVYNNSKLKVDIFVIDKERDLSTFTGDSFCLHWIEDLGIPNFKRLAFKYDIIELSTSVKPFIAKYLLKESRKVLFFDPDVMVFSSLDGIEADLDKHSVIVTPHYLHPKKNGDINDWRLMRFGFHNLGFFAVNDSSDSLTFLEWWQERCFEDCFTDSQFGVFTDQKWINIAIGFFPFVYSTSNIGYNVSFWNLDQRTIREEDGRYVMNDGSPMVFIHFSAFNFKHPEKWSRRDFDMGNNDKEIIAKLGTQYDALLKEIGKDIKDKKYEYDFFSNDTYITPTLRRAYAAVMDRFPEVNNPFDHEGPVFLFAKKNHLLSKRNKRYESLGYNDLKNERTEKKMEYVYSLMRLALRIMGPNAFMNLSRLFVYLSSYQKLPKMWK